MPNTEGKKAKTTPIITVATLEAKKNVISVWQFLAVIGKMSNKQAALRFKNSMILRRKLTETEIGLFR